MTQSIRVCGCITSLTKMLSSYQSSNYHRSFSNQISYTEMMSCHFCFQSGWDLQQISHVVYVYPSWAQLLLFKKILFKIKTRIKQFLIFFLIFSKLCGLWDLSFPTRDWTHTLCIWNSLKHWITKEVPSMLFYCPFLAQNTMLASRLMLIVLTFGRRNFGFRMNFNMFNGSLLSKTEIQSPYHDLESLWGSCGFQFYIPSHSTVTGVLQNPTQTL